MGQSLHFYRIKFFDVKVIENFDYDDILRTLIALLGKEKSEIDETIYNLVFEPIEEISTYISGNEPKLEKLLGTGAKNLLHPNSRCYLVTEELWKVIGKTIWEEAISALKSSDRPQETSQEYFKDWGILKILYTQKILMVEVS